MSDMLRCSMFADGTSSYHYHTNMSYLTLKPVKNLILTSIKYNYISV